MPWLLRHSWRPPFRFLWRRWRCPPQSWRCSLHFSHWPQLQFYLRLHLWHWRWPNLSPRSRFPHWRQHCFWPSAHSRHTFSPLPHCWLLHSRSPLPLLPKRLLPLLSALPCLQHCPDLPHWQPLLLLTLPQPMRSFLHQPVHFVRHFSQRLLPCWIAAPDFPNPLPLLHLLLHFRCKVWPLPLPPLPC